MCGIAGAIGVVDAELRHAVARMTDAQHHRGPDDGGSYAAEDGRAGVCFGFRRLSIIDLSPDGHQPMRDAERGNVVVFNGEIYNYVELRRELETRGERFASKSDTEVLLRGYAHWGNDVVRKLRGMFAFAIYDPMRQSVLLARDRLGIKPLYYAVVERGQGPCLLFASELRALLASALIPRRLDPAGVASFAWNGFVVGPTSIVRGVSLLSAGCLLSVPVDAVKVASERFWSLGTSARVSGRAALERLEHELSTATRQHLVADVPLGVFLSGGVDSSAVAALAVRSGVGRVQTFHIGFDEAAFDESAYARRVAGELGTEHAEYRLTQERFCAELDTALKSLDQPTFDAINTYFVSRVVREAGFTVALAGTGGDEIFGGYPTFRELPLASAGARALKPVPEGWLRGASELVSRMRAGKGNGALSLTRWAKLGDMLATRGDLLWAYQVAYALFTRDFLSELAAFDADSMAPHGLPPERRQELARLGAGRGVLSRVSMLELSLFIGERLLRDSDAASMAVSLELRVPLLDHGVVEAAEAVPDKLRFHPLGRKRLLKSLAMPLLDSAIFDRPKAGFVLPIELWAKDRLAGDIERLFSERALVESVGFDPEALDRLWKAFRAGAPGVYWTRVWAPYVLLNWCATHQMALG